MHRLTGVFKVPLQGVMSYRRCANDQPTMRHGARATPPSAGVAPAVVVSASVARNARQKRRPTAASLTSPAIFPGHHRLATCRSSMPPMTPPDDVAARISRHGVGRAASPVKNRAFTKLPAADGRLTRVAALVDVIASTAGATLLADDKCLDDAPAIEKIGARLSSREA